MLKWKILFFLFHKTGFPVPLHFLLLGILLPSLSVSGQTTDMASVNSSVLTTDVNSNTTNMTGSTGPTTDPVSITPEIPTMMAPTMSDANTTQSLTPSQGSSMTQSATSVTSGGISTTATTTIFSRTITASCIGTTTVTTYNKHTPQEPPPTTLRQLPAHQPPLSPLNPQRNWLHTNQFHNNSCKPSILSLPIHQHETEQDGGTCTFGQIFTNLISWLLLQKHKKAILLLEHRPPSPPQCKPIKLQYLLTLNHKSGHIIQVALLPSSTAKIWMALQQLHHYVSFSIWPKVLIPQLLWCIPVCHQTPLVSLF